MQSIDLAQNADLTGDIGPAPAGATPCPAADRRLPWWRDDAALTRLVTDLLAGELARVRPGADLPPGIWTAELDLGPDGLALDSLERVALATALTEMLHLHRSGIEDYLLARRRLGDWIRIAAAGLAVYDGEVTFRTSGSTGTPKACCHALPHLEEEVRHLARLVGPVRRVVRLVPSHHIYGFLFTVLLPARAAAAVVDGRGRLPGRIMAMLQPGDLVVAVPEQWAALARAGLVMPPGSLGVCSTGPLDPAVHRAVAGGSDGRLLEIYGASETAGIGWRWLPDQPFHLFPWWSLSADAASLHRPAAGGPALAVPDRLDMDGDFRFRVAGRIDGAVQVGGINVFPQHVAAVLRGHPQVRDAAVRPLAVADGLRLKAFIVPADPQAGPGLLTALQGWAGERLSPAELPRAWSMGPDLPRTPLGKPADWPVGQAAGMAMAAGPGPEGRTPGHLV